MKDYNRRQFVSSARQNRVLDLFGASSCRSICRRILYKDCVPAQCICRSLLSLLNSATQKSPTFALQKPRRGDVSAAC